MRFSENPFCTHPHDSRDCITSWGLKQPSTHERYVSWVLFLYEKPRHSGLFGFSSCGCSCEKLTYYTSNRKLHVTITFLISRVYSDIELRDHHNINFPFKADRSLADTSYSNSITLLLEYNGGKIIFSSCFEPQNSISSPFTVSFLICYTGLCQRAPSRILKAQN